MVLVRMFFDVTTLILNPSSWYNAWADPEVLSGGSNSHNVFLAD